MGKLLSPGETLLERYERRARADYRAAWGWFTVAAVEAGLLVLCWSL